MSTSEQFDKDNRYPNQVEGETPNTPQQYYLRTALYHGEDGSELAFNATPGDRAITIRHGAGTLIQVVDDGSMKIRVEGTTEQTFKKGLHLLISPGDDGDSFTIHVREGNAKLKFDGDLTFEAENINMTAVKDFNLKVGSVFRTEVNGDSSTQVNGRTSHKTDGDRVTVTGGNSQEEVQEKRFVDAKENNATIAENSTNMIGGENKIFASGTVGISGTKVSVSSTDLTTINSATGDVYVIGGNDVNVIGSNYVKAMVNDAIIRIEAGKTKIVKKVDLGIDDISDDIETGPQKVSDVGDVATKQTWAKLP